MKQSFFSPDKLYQILNASSPCHDYVVAYSGGMDSHVLLHSIASLSEPKSLNVKAFHVNHGLHAEADMWEEHCINTCRELSVDIRVLRPEVVPEPGESTEAVARVARYESIVSNINPGQIVVTAHHQKDQAETFILQLMRGSGITGLAAMPVLRQLKQGWLLRPLLQFEHDDLLAYARAHELHWVSDPSNVDIRYNRNYVRHKVLPALQSRWPSVTAAISRSARHLSEAVELADMLAQSDLESVLVSGGVALDLFRFTELPVIRRKNLLRYWIRNRCDSVPATGKLEQLARVFSESRQDRNPSIIWNNIEIRRYRNHIYLLPLLPIKPQSLELEWDLSSPLKLPLGTLKAYSANTDKQDMVITEKKLMVRFRRGGEQIQPAKRGHTHTVKNLFQEAGVPPWLRDYFPMIYVGDKLMMIPGLCSSREMTPDLFGDAAAISWELPDGMSEVYVSSYTTEIKKK